MTMPNSQNPQPSNLDSLTVEIHNDPTKGMPDGVDIGKPDTEKSDEMISSTDARFRVEALNMSNFHGGTPDEVVTRAETYRKFLSGTNV